MNFFKLIYIALLIVMSADRAYGQNKKILVAPDDSSFYQERSYLEKRIHLPDLKVTKEGKHWRFWYDKYIAAAFVIDVMADDSLNCKAFVNTYAYGDVVNNEKDRYSKIYHEKVEISTDAARALYEAATHIVLSRFAIRDTVGNSFIGHISIDAWPPTVEYANNKIFIFKTGLRPENVTQFNAVFDTAAKFVNFEKLKDDFLKNIPFGYYSADKWEGMGHVLTPKQIKKFNKYWRKHPERN